MKQALRRILVALPLALAVMMTFAPLALAIEDEGFTPEAAPSTPYFQETFWYPEAMLTNWKDFGAARTSETGGLFGAGLTAKAPLPKGYFLRPAGEVFGGHVSFTGNGTGDALSNDGGTDYLGLKVTGDLGRSFVGPATIGFEPFGGVGFRYWHRDIKPSGSQDFLERWTSLYLRGGLRAIYVVSKGASIYGEAGAAYPVFTRVSVSGPANGSFNPGGLVSAFAEVGADVGGYRPSVYYEGFRYSSDKAMAESQGNTVGFRFGVPF